MPRAKRFQSAGELLLVARPRSASWCCWPVAKMVTNLVSLRVLTRVDLLILSELRQRRQLVSLFQFCVEHNLSYEHAYARVRQLERQGFVAVQHLSHKRGQPLALQLTATGAVAVWSVFGVPPDIEQLLASSAAI